MRTSTAFSGMTVVFGVSIRTIYLSGNWSLLFKLAAGDARLARRCRLITLPLDVLLCLGGASVVVGPCYVELVWLWGESCILFASEMRP
ncbi:hypothetical protein FOXYSP1_20907 [Fusarium oxysporum f. sp. phaseoli]